MSNLTLPASSNDADSRRRAATLDADRRTAERLPAHPSLRLSAMGTSRGVSCRADNISEGGLFVLLPAEANLRVGERCEVKFTGEPTSSEAIPKLSLAGLTCYATVVRTESRAQGAPHLTGAGLRFDHPLFL